MWFVLKMIIWVLYIVERGRWEDVQSIAGGSRARRYEATSIINAIDLLSVIVTGAGRVRFVWMAFGPGSWHEPGLKGALSSRFEPQARTKGPKDATTQDPWQTWVPAPATPLWQKFTRRGSHREQTHNSARGPWRINLFRRLIFSLTNYVKISTL
jgi:hypothetical protein